MFCRWGSRDFVKGRLRRILLKNSARQICWEYSSCAHLSATTSFNFSSVIESLLHRFGRNRPNGRLFQHGVMVSGSSPEADRFGSGFRKRRPNMEYFAGLDVSMEETHVCVVTRNGTVIHEAKVPSTPASIAAALARVPSCQWVLFG